MMQPLSRAALLAVLLVPAFVVPPVRADDDPFGSAPAPARKKSPVENLIDLKVTLDRPEARRGETVKLTITGTPKPGYHTYPITQRTPRQLASQLTTFQYEDTPGLQPLWPVTESEPESAVEEGQSQEGAVALLEYRKTFTWAQDVLVLPDASPGDKALKFKIRLQVCDARKCVPGSPAFEVKVKVSDAPAVPLSAALSGRLNEKPKITVVGGTPSPEPVSPAAPPEGVKTTRAVPETVPESVAAPIAESAADYQAALAVVEGKVQAPKTSAPAGLLSFMLTGVFWGAVSLITPCVFPMIPITVSYFLKQSEKAHYRPVTMALVYCLTIVAVLTVAAAALLSFFRWLSVNPAMNYALGLLFVAFALSLFGMYELELPSGLARFTSAREGKGGLVGVVFMALTFTIVSFACVAPFLGGFSGTAEGNGFGLPHRLLGGLAFAATFASPFFILALFPGLLKALPKSGSWLNSVKVVMGFLELAAALKFFRAGELIQSAAPAFFTYDLVLGVWIALAFLCGLYLLSVYRLPHDSPAEFIGVPRLLFGVLFLSLSFYLLPALFKFDAAGEKQRPGGTVYAWIDSFLLPEPREAKGDLAWSGNLPRVIDEARAYRQRTGQVQRIFLDFTGETCTNCKFNENSVFPRSTVRPLFQPYRLVQLYTDKVPDKYYAPDLRGTFTDTRRQQRDADANRDFQEKVFGNLQLPLYVILEPQLDGTVRVVEKYEEGKINNVEAFARFLKGSGETGAQALAR